MYAYNTVQELVTLRNDADNCVISSSFSTRPPKLGRLAEVVAGTWGNTDKLSDPLRSRLPCQWARSASPQTSSGRKAPSEVSHGASASAPNRK